MLCIERAALRDASMSFVASYQVATVLEGAAAGTAAVTPRMREEREERARGG